MLAHAAQHQLDMAARWLRLRSSDRGLAHGMSGPACCHCCTLLRQRNLAVTGRFACARSSIANMQCWNPSVRNAEYKKAMAGEYKERATEFLESHWQRDALASLARHGVRICSSLLFLCYWLVLFFSSWVGLHDEACSTALVLCVASHWQWGIWHKTPARAPRCVFCCIL